MYPDGLQHRHDAVVGQCAAHAQGAAFKRGSRGSDFQFQRRAVGAEQQAERFCKA